MTLEDHSNSSAPELSEEQHQEVQERTSVKVDVVHEAVRLNGEEELNRSTGALAWSGLAAGLSMGFSFVGQALFQAYLPDAPWRPLLVNLGYPLGFLIVISAPAIVHREYNNPHHPSSRSPHLGELCARCTIVDHSSIEQFARRAHLRLGDH